MRILILALSGIGDALMFTPALSLLRRSVPEAQIDVLVMFRGASDIFRRHPAVHHLYLFEFLKEGYWSSLRFLYKLRGQYDASINVYPSNRKEYNLINFLVGAKKRAGVRYRRRDAWNWGFLNNVRITEDDRVHNVQENIRLCERLLESHFHEEPAMEFALSADDEKAAEDFLARNEVGPTERLVGFHPGSAVLKNHLKRRWEPEKFIDLGKQLIREHGVRILVFGGNDEQELKERIVAGIGITRAVNISMTDLGHTAALIRRCHCFVTNDSSLMHVAAAMSVRTVAIIGPTNPHYIRPWKTDHRLVSLNLDCSPCFYYSPRPLICSRTDVKFKCIKELGVDLVHGAVQQYLSS